MKQIILFIIILTLVACQIESEIDYSLPYAGDRLIVQGFISAEEGVTVSVRKTVPILNDKTSDVVKGAKVSLFENDKFVAYLEEYPKGLFVNNTFLLKKGNDYHIKVTAEGLPEVSSPKQKIIEKVIMQNPTLVFTKLDSSEFQVECLIKDKAEVSKNAYEIVPEIYFNDTLYTRTPFYQFIRNYPMIDDTEFNGKSKKFTEIINLIETVKNGKIPKHTKIKVKLYSYSMELITFFESLLNYELSKEDPFINPIPVYNNVSGGYGFFGAYSVDSFTF